MTVPGSRLSVLMITYNHEMFVAKAIKSILMQEIAEPYEIVVADDCSTDGTLEAIRSVARANPDVKFRFLDTKENLGITKNYQRAFKAITSDYVAVIEGDDYWVDTQKLRAQLAFLDRHRECGLCSVNYYVFEEDLCKFTPRVPAEDNYIIFGARELIADNLVGNFSTCMYRTQALKELPPAIFEMRSYDWAINICIGKSYMIGFLRSPMSVYRIHRGGSWSLLSYPEKIKAQLQLIPEYDAVTGGVFHPEFSQLSCRLTEYLTELNNLDSLTIACPATEKIPEFHPSRSSALSRCLDISPPFVVSLARHLLPPLFKRYIGRWLMR